MALAGVAVAASGCGIGVSAETLHENRSYDVSEPVSTVRLGVDSDRIEVVGADVTKVTVHERLSFTKGERPTSKNTTVNGTLHLRYDCRDGIHIGISPTCKIGYRVTVPRDTNVQLTGDSGRLQVTGVAGSVNAHTDSGTINLVDLRSPKVVATSDSGTIQVAGKAETSTLRTNSGTITAENLTVSSLTASTDSGRIRATCTAPPSNVMATSDSGAVELVLPGDRAYAVVTNTDAGPETIDVNRDPASQFRVRVSTDSGAIKILEA
ncbi:hypothetical protein GCM10009780_66260 [Actinomadura alba]